MGVRYSNGKSHDFADFLNTGILNHKLDFLVRFSDRHLNTGPFDNQTQIYHLNTRLVQYSDGYCSLVLEFSLINLYWKLLQTKQNLGLVIFPKKQTRKNTNKKTNKNK